MRRFSTCQLVPAVVATLLSSGAAYGQTDSVSKLACTPATLSSGTATTCTVTLNAAAPAGGLEVMLSSNDTLLPVPGTSVTVQAGATSATFTATAGSISSNQSATLTATALNSVSLSWSASSSTNVTNYDVYRGASSGGPYSVIGTTGAVTTYTDYNIQNGQTYYYVTAAVNTSGEESGYSNQATAVVPSGISETATITLTAPPVALSSLTCSPTSLNSGAATTCTIGLSTVAPTGGTVVSLASNSTLLPVPASSVTVPPGLTSASFTATAGTISSNQSATLTATLSGVSETATISLTAPAAVTLSSLACSPTSLNSGAATTCTVGLSGAAPTGGTVVSLSSNDTLLPVPASSVKVPAGSASTSFTATAKTISTNQSATLTATLSSGSKTATVSLMGPLSVNGISPNSSSGAGGTAVTITGANFVSGATVTFGGTAATNVSIVSSTSITATTPAHAAGAVTVSVTANGQTASLADGFTYTSSVPIGFEQVAYTTPQSPQKTVSVTYPSAQAAGDLNIIVVGWNDVVSTVQSVTDSAGNTYHLAIGPKRSQSLISQSIYYANGVIGGSNTVTVAFNQAANYPDIRILEYQGVNTLDVTAGKSGNSATSQSGAATTTAANELIFGANTVETYTSGSGRGYTTRVITSPDGDLAEDEVGATAGSYNAKATVAPAGQWVMQMVTFK